MNAAEAARLAAAALAGGEPIVSAVVVESAEPALVGRRMVVCAGRQKGTLGDPGLDARVAEQARALLAGTDEHAVQQLDQAGAECTVYLEVHRPAPELVIVGAGHIARPLCRIGAMLGFQVVVLDDRPEFVTRERFPDAARIHGADLFAAPFRDVALGSRTYLVLVTRGHKYDYQALRDALTGPELPYIGMVGSQRRTRAALEQLVRDGIPPERLGCIHAPIGLDIGAETPEEIAVAIAAELTQVRRGGTGAPLRDHARVVERWFQRLD